VALLLGIGPSNPNMKGEKLKGLFEMLGFSNVQTIITSGNVIFESQSQKVAELTDKIEKALPVQLGFNSTVILRTESQLQNLVDQDPYKGLSHNKTDYLLVTFFKKMPEIKFKMPFTPESKPYTILGRIDDAVYGRVDISRGK